MTSSVASPEQSKASNGGTTTKSSSMSTLISARVWEIYSPPPINSFKGAVLPRIMQKRQRRRKVSLEVHRVEIPGKTEKKDISFEECIVRVLDPENVEVHKAAQKRGQMRRKEHDHTNACVTVGATSTISSPPETNSLIDDDDDASTVGVPADFLDLGSSNFAMPDYDKGWKAKYRFPINALKIRGTHKTGVQIDVDLGKHKETRELIFDNIEESEGFRSAIEQELKLEDQRREAKLNATLGGLKLASNEKITFLIEIVSAWDILAGDFFTSDPYVLCMFNHKEVHRTKYIPKTLDPIWTVKTKSLFLLEVDTKELFLSEGLLCSLYDYDKVGANEKLGAITIPPKTLYDAKGERMEFKLGPSPGETKDVPGYLSIRCRRATDYDANFMTDFEKGTDSDLLGLKAATSKAHHTKGGASNIKSLMSRNTKTEKNGEKAGIKQYKIRPEPDPKRAEETTWMTKKEIEAETTNKSQNWIDVGTGKLGRLFVEILGCDGLPNLDSGGFAGNKTDTFVALVYEDSTLQTDVIDDSLSPRWLPWSKRAFIFHTFHSSSQLFLGVFDYDESLNPTDDHDLIGRVSVDLTNLQKDTVYTLKYEIFDTARMTQRAGRGFITARIRIEIEDDRKLLLSNLEPPPQMYVNVTNRKDFRVIRYTCTGKYDMDKYSMKVINSYVDELLSLQHVMMYAQDAVMALLLWRGTFRLHLFGRSMLFPIHSLSAFILAVFLVERPQLLPSCFFASIAWLLLATMGYRRSLPDVWSRCRSYGELIETLAVGESSTPPASIKARENYKEAVAFREAYHRRVLETEVKAQESYEEALKTQEEYEKEIEEIGDTDTDIATKRGGYSIDPFKRILFPVQQNLAMVCRYVRHTKYVILWDECYLSFWITTGCLLVSLLFLFVPWGFLIKWGARLSVWALFGPWMKLVDIYYVREIESLTEDEIAKQKHTARERRKLATTAAVSEARVKRENAAKLKAMKKQMFGKFITRVPVLKEDRYRDVPLPDSMATPYQPEPLPLSELAMQEAGYHRTRLPGQHLTGDMIPRAESHGFTEAPIGQATAYPKLVDKDGPGGSVKTAPESTAEAYAKIGFLFVAAAVVTVFGVPLLAAVTEKALHWF